jgi:hypothetical protein
MTKQQSNISNRSIMDNEMSVKELFLKIGEWSKYLFSKWLMILILGSLGVVLGFIYTTFKKPIYISTTSFVLEEGSSGGMGGLGQYAGLASMVGVDIGSGGGLFQGDNIIHLYKSRKMIERALLTPIISKGSNQLLIDRYLKLSELSKKNEHDLKSIDFKHDTLNRYRDSIISLAVFDINKNYLSVSRLDKKLSIINVIVKANDELFAKEFIDKLVANVNSFYIETKTKKLIHNVNILQHQTDSVRAVMNGAISSSASYLDATPNLNPSKQILRAPAQRSMANADANKAILTELIKNLELSKMSLRRESPLIQIIDQPVYPLIKEKMGRILGGISGGFLFGLVTVIVLVIKKLYEGIINGN